MRSVQSWNSSTDWRNRNRTLLECRNEESIKILRFIKSVVALVLGQPLRLQAEQTKTETCSGVDEVKTPEPETDVLTFGRAPGHTLIDP